MERASRREIRKDETGVQNENNFKMYGVGGLRLVLFPTRERLVGAIAKWLETDQMLKSSLT